MDSSTIAFFLDHYAYSGSPRDSRSDRCRHGCANSYADPNSIFNAHPVLVANSFAFADSVAQANTQTLAVTLTHANAVAISVPNSGCHAVALSRGVAVASRRAVVRAGPAAANTESARIVRRSSKPQSHADSGSSAGCARKLCFACKLSFARAGGHA